jgi:outer membrane beta-barrel protein
MKHGVLTAALGAALAATTVAPRAAQAQEIQLRGPLANAVSVRRLVQYRVGRIGLTPTFGITLQDQFSRDLFFGVRAEYHVADWLGLGIWGAFAPVHVDTSLTEQISQRSPARTLMSPQSNANVPVASQFPQQIGRRNFIADVHLSFIPLRGKFALFQNLVADVDFSVFAGAAFIGVEERLSVSQAPSAASGSNNAERELIRQALNRSQRARESRVAVAPTFGINLNFYINRFVAFNVEYRAFPFLWNTSGTDESSVRNRCGAAGNQPCTGVSDIVATYFEPNARDQRSVIDANDRTFQFNQMVNFGLTVFLPTGPRIGE